MVSHFSDKVLAWFEEHGRHDLPWQRRPSAYRVWVSEIMLQQTQVSTVIDYYRRFMRRFPSLKQLASANQDQVLSYWSGLGYYARARNLHKTAQIVHQQLRGRFPQTVAELTALPGIGPSTAGAILSLSSGAYAVILDGNIKRVLARHAAIGGWPGDKGVHERLWQLAKTHTPRRRTKDYNQAMMDIGSLLCTRTQPKCDLCPISRDCKAWRNQTQLLFPEKKPKKTRRVKETYMLILQDPNGAILLEKRSTQGIWGGLWSFPESSDPEQAVLLWQTTLGRRFVEKRFLPELKHSFSHFDLLIKPVLLRFKKSLTAASDNSYYWYQAQHAPPGGIAAPIRLLLNQLHEEHHV